MPQSFRTLVQSQLLTLLVGMLLAGCAGTSVTSRNDTSDSVHKLASAKVVWIANPSLPYEINKSANGYRPTIDESDKQYARQVVGRLLTLFQRSAPQMLSAELAKRGVVSEDAATITISPTTANVNIGGGRGFTSHVSVQEGKNGKELWSVTIKAFGPPWDNDKVLLTNFVARLLTELEKAGWLD